MPNIGELVSDFTLPNQDGKMITLSQFRGQKVVIFAFPKANSLGCTMQACAFRDALPRFDELNAVVLGISADTQAELRLFKQIHKLPYDLLSDIDHSVLETWHAWGTNLLGVVKIPMIKRSYWVVDETGRLLGEKIGAGPNESLVKAIASITQAPRPVGA